MLLDKNGQGMVIEGKEFTVGCKVYTKINNDYPCLLGEVLEIRTDEDKQTDGNEDIDIVCAFNQPTNPEIIKSILGLYGNSDVSIEDIGLDCVVQAASMLEIEYTPIERLMNIAEKGIDVNEYLESIILEGEEDSSIEDIGGIIKADGDMEQVLEHLGIKLINFTDSSITITDGFMTAIVNGEAMPSRFVDGETELLVDFNKIEECLIYAGEFKWAVRSNDEDGWLQNYIIANRDKLMDEGCQQLVCCYKDKKSEPYYLHMGIEDKGMGAEKDRIMFIVQDVDMDFDWEKDVFYIEDILSDINKAFYSALDRLKEVSELHNPIYK